MSLECHGSKGTVLSFIMLRRVESGRRMARPVARKGLEVK